MKAKRASRRAADTAGAADERAPAARRTKRATNLTLDPAAVARGERFGARHGKSLSQLVNDLLSALPGSEQTDEVDPADLAPAVRRLFGVAAGGSTDRQAYRDHLIRKYGGTGP